MQKGSDFCFFNEEGEIKLSFLQLQPHKNRRNKSLLATTVPARPAPARHGGGSCGRPCAAAGNGLAMQPFALVSAGLGVGG